MNSPLFLTWGIRIAGAAAILIGGFHLTAWLGGFAAHWSAMSGQIVMKTNMALGQILAGVALLLAGPETAGRARRIVGSALALIVLAIGALTLSEHLFRYDLGIDQLLAREAPGALATVSPNRIGVPGSLSLTLLGAGLLALALRRRAAVPYLGLAVCLINLVPAVGFLLGIEDFFSQPRLTGIAWPTVLVLLSLGVGLVVGVREAGPMVLLLRDDPGGALVRQLCPLGLLLPPVLGFLRVEGQRFGWYDTATGTGMLVLALVVIFSVALWRSAGSLSRAATAEADAQRTLRESQTRLATFAEATFEGIVESEVGRIVDCNDQFARMLGRSVAELRGVEIASLIAPEDRDRVMANIRQNRDSWIEHAALRRDGRRIVVEAHGRPVSPDSAKRHTAVRDITERKRAEEELERHRLHLEQLVQERTAELKQSMGLVEAERQRLKDALDRLPAYVILLSLDYRVPFANRFFEERFGKSEGQRCYEYLFHRTEPCQTCETYSVLKTHRPHRWEWLGPDGRNYDIYDFPFTDADGSPLIMEVGLDITEIKKAQTALQQLNQALEQRVAERTAELRESNQELEEFNRAMVGRELRMIELKQEINAVCAQFGQPPRYPLDGDEEQP